MTLKRANLIKKVGEGSIHVNMDDAVKHANAVLRAEGASAAIAAAM